MSDTRLRIQSRVNITEPLPLAQLARIESVDGVANVGYYNFFGGYYQEPSQNVAVGAVDVDRLAAIFPEVDLPKDAVEAMRQTRNGALIGRDLAAQRGWKVGDRVPMRSSIWQRKDGAAEWPFEIVGVYEFADGKIPSNEMWINYAYFDEARAAANGTVTLYFAHIAEPRRAAEISENIDRLFANSTFETATQNERDWIRGRIAQIGDIGFFVNAIIGAVMFALLFLTGNTMMQSVRERIPELAVLKTYGYSNAGVTALVFAESILLCAAAAAAGLGIAALASPRVFRAIGAGGMGMPAGVVATGLAIAVLVAVVSALPPARRAHTLSIVDALAGR
jgi:putative ABC transport system permease protein